MKKKEPRECDPWIVATEVALVGIKVANPWGMHQVGVPALEGRATTQTGGVVQGLRFSGCDSRAVVQRAWLGGCVGFIQEK
nr:hypothetical protein [Tanacetum cinerariifolium]